MSKKIVIEVILGLALLCLLVTGIVGVQAFRSPLAQPLNLTLAATETPDPAQAAQPTAPPTVVPAQKTTCGSSGSQIVLAIGRDQTFWEPPYGADAIRVVKVDYSNKKITVFAFPRDLFVKTPSLEATYGVKEFRLGELYMFVREKEGNVTPAADEKASAALAQTIYDNFGLAVDQYITIEESVLPKMIDTVGGIEVVIPTAINENGLNIKAGKQSVDGKTAMMYSRYLKGGLASTDEWGRMDRQALIVKAFATKLFKPESVLVATDLFDQIKDAIVTDLSVEQIANLACMGKEISLKDVTAETINREQVNILADETMVIKDDQLGPIKTKLDSLFSVK
ncbi:MAG TPA: LCP family protein [Anaerolineaceae bacterium]